MVTIYTQPNCQPCRMTKIALTGKGISYQEVDITKDPKALEHVKSLGYLQAPVVVAGDQHWSGFDPIALATL